MDKAAYKDAVLRDLKEVVKVDVQRGKDRPMSSYINLGIEFLKRRFQSSNKWNRNKAWTPKALQYVTNLWMEIEPEIILGTEKMLQDAKHRKLTKEMRATTARAAIRTAMQEAGSKLSRDNNKASYRAFRKLCLMVIELIRQFYDMPRTFRIMGENGAERFIQYSNAGILPQHQGFDFGEDMGFRIPLFDIEITAQKQSPYSKMSQNELALQFYQAGFFNPQMADQALACLDMMDFDRKHFIMQKIAQNGGMYQQMLMMQQQMLQLAQIVDGHEGTNLAEQMAAGIMGGSPVAPNMGGQAPSAKVQETEALGGKEGGKESSHTQKARQRVAESTDPT